MALAEVVALIEEPPMGQSLSLNEVTLFLIQLEYARPVARNIEEQALGEVDASLTPISGVEHRREQDLQNFGMFDLLPCQTVQQMLALETFDPALLVPLFLIIFNCTAKVQAHATSL
jgi:hypothetical protein